MHRLNKGDTFGRLTVIGPAEYESRFHACRGWSCRCSCGKVVSVVSRNLVRGISRSCGCLRDESIGNRRRTHGRCRTREYSIWCDMKRRCYDERNKRYHRYGGRGITVCREWRKDFAAFLRDMGQCPPGHTLDRIDNDGNYTPKNCRWATATTQANNKPGYNHPVTLNGRTMTLALWCRELGISKSVVYHRMSRKGMTAEQALSV